MRYNKINVFFDTNKLECRFDKEKLFLDDIKLHKDLEEIINFSSDNDNISFYIPYIVWQEILNHLIECFRNSKKSLENNISNIKKEFGELIDISVNLNVENYEEYINNKAIKLLNKYNEKINIVSHDIHEEKFKTIVKNVIKKVAPFTTVRGKNKTYSDAGFKDMLILETIIDNCKYDEIGILYTDDRDFKDAFREYENDKYFIIHTIDDLKKLISNTSEKFIEKNIRKKFLKDEYLQETIYNELKINSEDVSTFNVMEILEADENYSIRIKIITSIKDYMMIVYYDEAANEIISIESED